MTSITLAPTRPVPAEVSTATTVWLAAVGAGVAETLVRLTLLPDPPTGAELLVRFGVYTAVALLVLALPAARTSGVRNAVRWALVLGLGGIGTVSLVVEPVRWLLAGGDPVVYLGAADGPTVLVVALRLAHVLAVLGATALVFRPAARAYFRGRP